MRILALLIGKTIYTLLRLLRKRGAALPGLVVERMFPKFLANSLNLLPQGVIIITGTNGKTTSTKMLTHVLRAEYKVLTNPTGSNFVRGIVSSIIQHSSWKGAMPYDIGVFELDEAYAAQFVKLYSPRVVVILNVMRDQMDRFGEIDHTAKLLTEVVRKTTDFVILNGDDARVSAMESSTKAHVYYFGVDHSLRSLFRSDDELHDGPSKTTKQLNISAKLMGFDDQNIATIELPKETIKTVLSARGTYNAQNATAVVLTANMLNIGVDTITTKISEVSPAFGRGEHIEFGEKKIILQLVKNPGGFRHALISGQDLKQDVTVIAINDDYADGRDVSWLWDVDFASGGVAGLVMTTGTRATDMALRLNYDGIKTNHIESDLQKTLDSALKQCGPKGTVLIYTTYTAMLSLRRLISQITKVDKV